MEFLLAGGKDEKGNESIYLEKWKELPKKERNQLKNLWGGKYTLANLRNDVLHAGFRKKPKSSEDIIQKTKDILEELKSVSKNWKLDTKLSGNP